MVKIRDSLPLVGGENGKHGEHDSATMIASITGQRHFTHTDLPIISESASHIIDEHAIDTEAWLASMAKRAHQTELSELTKACQFLTNQNLTNPSQRMSGSNEDLRRDLYSQYGGLYYGIHRLMLYPANYNDPIYRFADYNSGMYSSRNTAFQKMLSEIAKQPMDLDGDLLNYSGNLQSQSEKALNTMATQGLIALTPRQIHSDLSKEKTQSFETTQVYTLVSQLYQQKTGKKPLAAIMPQVVISGAKLSKDYNTKWYADSVNKRYLACLAKVKS